MYVDHAGIYILIDIKECFMLSLLGQLYIMVEGAFFFFFPVLGGAGGAS